MSSPWLSELASSSAPEAISSSIAPARACICAVLSSARWIAMPTSPISSPMPDIASLILRLGLGGRVRRLDRLLAGTERLDLGAEPLLGEGELLLLALELRLLRLEVGDLLGEPRLAGQRLAGEVLAARR